MPFKYVLKAVLEVSVIFEINFRIRRDVLPNTIIKAKDLISLTRVVAIICNSFRSRLTQRTLQLSRLPVDFWGALLPLSIACQTLETRHSTFVAGRLKTLLLPNNFPSIFSSSQPDELECLM